MPGSVAVWRCGCVSVCLWLCVCVGVCRSSAVLQFQQPFTPQALSGEQRELTAVLQPPQ